MSTTFSYQILTCIEAVYVGCTKPSELDKTNRWSILFTSFINTAEKVLSPDVASQVIDDTFSVKLEQSALQSLLPILKPKSFYRLILGVRDWSMNGRSGMSFRLIDISPIKPEESLFNAYIGKLKEVAIDSDSEMSKQSSSVVAPVPDLQQFLS